MVPLYPSSVPLLPVVMATAAAPDKISRKPLLSTVVLFERPDSATVFVPRLLCVVMTCAVDGPHAPRDIARAAQPIHRALDKKALASHHSMM
jgi:hypothetical protein